MPIVIRRLVYLAMAQVRPGEGLLDVTMLVGDIARALDMGDAGPIYDRIRASVSGAVGYILEIEHPDKGWELFTWLSYAQYDPKADTITLRINEALRPYVLEVQKNFATFAIADIAKLQSRHSLRWFELVMSRQSQADPSGYWWYELELTELRHLFKIGATEYRITGDLRKRVIDASVKEINEAGIGVQLKPEFFRRGRKLFAVRMHCQKIRRGDPKPVHAHSPEEAADEVLIATNPERYAKLLAEIRSQTDLPGIPWVSPAMKTIAQEAEALTRLKAEQKPKRGRPKKARPQSEGPGS